MLVVDLVIILGASAVVLVLVVVLAIFLVVLRQEKRLSIGRVLIDEHIDVSRE